MAARGIGLIAGVAVLGLGSLGVWAWSGRSGSHALPDAPRGFDRAHSAFTPESVRRFAGFPVYWAGHSFEGIPLRRILVAGAASPDASALMRGPVAFAYSDERDCRTVPDGAVCAHGTRFVVETAILCRRAGAIGAARRTRLRGVPAARWERGHLELYSGRVSIRIDADGDARATRLAGAVRTANRAGPSAGPLRAPSAANPGVRGVDCHT